MLVPCKRCRRHISDRDDVCPFCRHGSALAKVGAAALSAGVLLSGCDQGTTPRRPQRGSAQTAPVKTTGTLHGVLTDRSGKPLAGASLNLFVGEDPQATATETSDEKGAYSFDHVEPGPYVLRVLFNGYEGGVSRIGDHERNVVLEAGQDATLDITMDVRDQAVAPPYGAPPARRRVI